MNPRDTLAALLQCGLASVDGERATERALDGTPRGPERFLLAAGKAACAMARGAERALGESLRGGLVVTKDGCAESLDPVHGTEVLEASHPLPDARAVTAAERALALAASLDRSRELLVLISGGASALWTAPVPGVSLADARALTDALLRSGATIEELNATRKHVSRIKGGGLARAAAGCAVRTLLISDVAGDRLDVIGSGPTAPDPTRYADALDVLRQRKIEAPASIRVHLEAGAAGRHPETAKPGNPVFARVQHEVVATLAMALDAVDAEARSRGLRVERVERGLEGEARECGVRLARRALALRGTGPALLLAGGEPTVTVHGDGVGGRAQEAALAFALEVGEVPGVVALISGTDGSDGPTRAAGACVDAGTLARARAAGLDAHVHLERNDSHPLLDATGDLIVTGPTRTNVTDLALVAVG